MNNITDPKNYFYFCLKSEIYKVYINNLQETVVKQIKHQIENEEAIVCLVDCMRYYVKQEDKQQQQQTMINQVKIKNDVLKQRKRSYPLKKFDKNRVNSHLIELFHTPIDDIECGPLPPKRKCLNKTTNQQLWYAIVDILDDLKLEDAILYPKLENLNEFKRESITIRTETNNLINYKCVKNNNKPIVLRAITNVRQIKNESVVDLTETITENNNNNINTNNNTDNNNDSETIINQRQSVITFTTLKTTPDLNNGNKINNNNNDNTNSNNNTNNDNNNSNNDGISSTISNNDNNSDYILIIYQYLRNYLKLLYEINNCYRVFTQILKKCKYEYIKIFVQLFNKATCEISEELIKHIISSQLQQLQTIEMDEMFIKLSEFLKKNDNIIIGRYKLFYHIYQLLKPHKEYIHNVILLKRIYDEIEMYLKENDNRPTNQLQQQKNVLNQPRPETQALLNRPQQHQQDNLSNQALLNQQQQKNVLNQPRPEAQTLLNQQQQKNVLNQPRPEAQALLNRPQQQENLSNQQQKNVLNQQRGVAQALNYQQRQQQQQENVLNQSRPIAQALLSPQQQQQHQENILNLPKSIAQALLNYQQQENALNQPKPVSHAFLSHQQQQQETVLNQHRSIVPALPSQQQQQQPSVPVTQALFNLQQQQLQQRLWQQQQRDNQQRPVAVILMNQQRQENELNQSRSVAQAVWNHQQQQQDNILHHAKSVTRNLLNQQQPRQQENTIENLSNQIKQQKQNNMRPLQKIQNYQKQQEQQHSSKNTPTNLPLTDHCISTLLSNQQLKPQPQPQVKTSIIFTQIQLRILETQIKEYHKLFTVKVNSKHSSVKQNNQQQSQNNTSKQPQQNQSTPVSSSSTHQFVNNLGNIIRKVDANAQNLNNHRLIKPVNNGQLLKQQLSNEKSNNPSILRNTLDIYSNLSKVPEQSPPQQVPSVANLSVLEQQQQRKPSTVLPALGQISSVTITTTPVLSPSNPILAPIRDVRILQPPTTITTSITSSILSPLITTTTTTVTPTTSLSDSLFASIPPPRITENATLPTTKTTITTSLSLPILTVTTTPTTTVLTSSKSTPIVAPTTTTTLSKEIKEPVLTTVSKIVESTSTTIGAIREEVDTRSESVSPVQQSTETRPESGRVSESPRSLSPTLIVSSSTSKPSITVENNDKSVKFLESFEMKDEDFKQIDSNYENETIETSMYSKFNDYINIDDLDKHIKIEDKIGGVSPSDSGLGSPFDLDMADLLHSNNNNNNNNNNNTLNDIEESQPIQDVSSYIIQGPNEEPFICLCGKKAQYLCACGFSMYCSEACRLIDWECHQSLCLRTIR